MPVAMDLEAVIAVLSWEVLNVVLYVVTFTRHINSVTQGTQR